MSEPRKLTCGCCTEGCVCVMHQDIPRGVPPTTCATCKHREARHGQGRCDAKYSAGPSGTFRCRCEQFTAPPKGSP